MHFYMALLVKVVDDLTRLKSLCSTDGATVLTICLFKVWSRTSTEVHRLASFHCDALYEGTQEVGVTSPRGRWTELTLPNEK